MLMKLTVGLGPEIAAITIMSPLFLTKHFFFFYHFDVAGHVREFQVSIRPNSPKVIPSYDTSTEFGRKTHLNSFEVFTYSDPASSNKFSDIKISDKNKFLIYLL